MSIHFVYLSVCQLLCKVDFKLSMHNCLPLQQSIVFCIKLILISCLIPTPFFVSETRTAINITRISNVRFTFAVTMCFSWVVSSTIFIGLTNSHLRHTLIMCIDSWQIGASFQPYHLYLWARVLCCFAGLRFAKNIILCYNLFSSVWQCLRLS